VEVQLAVLTEDIAGTAQVACLHRLAADATAREGSLPVQLRPARVDELPVVVSYDEALALAEHDPAATALLVGVGGDTLGLRTVDMEIDGQGLLVVGPPRSGRSSALLSTVEFALDRRWSVVVITPRRSPLRALEGRPNVHGVFADTAEPDQLRRALAATRGSRLLVVDRGHPDVGTDPADPAAVRGGLRRCAGNVVALGRLRPEVRQRAGDDADRGRRNRGLEPLADLAARNLRR
jgi:S-DNA-T family DNA segregation ATPase FtsK/SpoIIIE